MREELLKALSTKFQGVDAKVLGRVATKLVETASAGADAQSIADAVTFADVLQSYGDSRANEAAISSVRNYEEKWGIKDGKTIKEDTRTNDNNFAPVGGRNGNDTQTGRQQGEPSAADLSAMIANAIKEAVSPLQQQIAAFQGEKVAATRRERLTEATKALPEAVRNRYARDFERMNFADDADFDAYLTELQPDIKAITDDYSRKATVTTPPKNPAVVSADDMKKVNPLILERAQRVGNDKTKASPIVRGSAIETPADTQTTN